MKIKVTRNGQSLAKNWVSNSQSTIDLANNVAKDGTTILIQTSIILPELTQKREYCLKNTPYTVTSGPKSVPI